MRPARVLRGIRHAVALAAVVSLVLSGCSGATAEPAARDPVVALRIAAPVHGPVWAGDPGGLLALTEGIPRIAKIDPGETAGMPRTARTVLSRPFPDAGENIAAGAIQGWTGEPVVYLPQPRLGRVAAIGIADLHRVGTLDAGPSPSFVSVNAGARMLLALAEDGRTVTAVDLHDRKIRSSQRLDAGPLAEVDGAKRGRRIDYHVAGPAGIAHYKGPPGAVEKKGEISLGTGKSVGDHIKVTRLYAAGLGTDRLFAVDSMRTLHGLEVVAEASLGEPVRHLGVDEARLYAATERTLWVFETNSFEGYRNGTFPLLGAVKFRTALPAGAARLAPLSGLAVGPDRVYLTLTGEPYVVSVAKPEI